MSRWFVLLLTFCLVLQDQPKAKEISSRLESSGAIQVEEKKFLFQNEDLLRQDLLAGIALATTEAFPGAVPWAGIHEVGAKGLYPLEALLHYHPLTFLEMCLERYQREVQGYSATLFKRERLAGKLGDLEKIEIHFREHPFSVYMNWLQGGEGLTKPQKVLYVNGENNNKLLARSRVAFLGVFEKDVAGEEAKQTGRYTLDQFGMYLGTKRSVASMLEAKKLGQLHLEYKGLYEVQELGRRRCYKLVRTPFVKMEEEALNELDLYIDQENWLQVGSVLYDKSGQLIAEYFFRDVKINPQFKNERFTRGAL